MTASTYSTARAALAALLDARPEIAALQQETSYGVNAEDWDEAVELVDTPTNPDTRTMRLLGPPGSPGQREETYFFDVVVTCRTAGNSSQEAVDRREALTDVVTEVVSDAMTLVPPMNTPNVWAVLITNLRREEGATAEGFEAFSTISVEIKARF